MKNLVCITLMSLAFTHHSRTTAQEVPIIINMETGTQVDLVRPYWNANVDIANRRIHCDNFVFDQEAAVYSLLRDSPPDPGGDFHHNPLSEGDGLATVDHDYLVHFVVNSWTVIDGLYSGIAPLTGQFIELINYKPSTDLTEHNAVRYWYSVGSSVGVRNAICYDLDGAPLVPTGSAEIGNTDLLPEQNFTFQLPRAGTPVTEASEIIRLDTGEAVEFVRAEFDYNGDLRGKTMNCGSYNWDESRGYYSAGLRGTGERSYENFLFAYTGGATIPHTFAWDDAGDLTTISSIEGFLHEKTKGASFIEVSDSGFNMWSDSSWFYYGCDITLRGSEVPFAANRIVLTPQDSCDYSGADQYGGWGWNPATLQSCEPHEITPSNNTQAEQCDFTNAHVFNGWGWNSILGESCAPRDTELTTPPDTRDCVDTDNDGWGWDGTASCQISVQCIDTDGDGWGWDGTSSCMVN